MKAAPEGAYLHHIGSTAVPGLPSKDIIDMQLTVLDLAVLDNDLFARQGFEFVPGLTDHCPAGLEVAPIELEKRFYRSHGRAANLHIRQKGRFNQRYALLCRDFLRAHPASAQAYALIKSRLAGHFPENPKAYYDIKDPVFDIIVDGANIWAQSTGWSEPPAD